MYEEEIPLEILPGCDFPLSFEALEFFNDGQVLTINDVNRYLFLYRVAIKKQFMVAAGFSLRLHRRDAYATD